ncbi:Hypothetical predicted protein [Lecanosticta acicola]|uniref:Uncharacterized protein n=1 Tax=Lecanosticta acicola TaxID=111012 RepID=A0AAI9EC82_9PEZI|nr:Hypothetical predicted protein [Lecanosticta acicola]
MERAAEPMMAYAVLLTWGSAAVNMASAAAMHPIADLGASHCMETAVWESRTLGVNSLFQMGHAEAILGGIVRLENAVAHMDTVLYQPAGQRYVDLYAYLVSVQSSKLTSLSTLHMLHDFAAAERHLDNDDSFHNNCVDEISLDTFRLFNDFFNYIPLHNGATRLQFFEHITFHQRFNNLVDYIHILKLFQFDKLYGNSFNKYLLLHD